MLKFISWHAFITSLSMITAAYYIVVILIFYRKEIRAVFPLLLIGLLISITTQAQTADGNAGISQANTMIRGYYDFTVQLMYAIGAIGALIGAIDVYNKYQTSHQNAKTAAAAWFGALIFLVIVATVIKSFFGL